jgi:hypothetical protein
MADHPMKTFVTQDGRHFLIPGNPACGYQRAEAATREDGYQCDCHQMMGNDFYFLPVGQCIRKDKTCNRVDA